MTSLSRERERDLILAILRDHDHCVVFPPEAYVRPDGFLPVHRDGLQELLHRRLYRLVRNQPIGRQKLERTCETWGCVNPFHHVLRVGLEKGSRTRCGNGHVYADVGVTDTGHCAVCAARRQARRHTAQLSQAEMNLRKRACPKGHPYDEENTYRQPTRSGYRRKCRACNRALSRIRRVVQSAPDMH